MRIALTPRDAASYDLSSDWTETDSPTLIFQRAWNASETLMIRLLDGCTIFGEVHSFYADGDIIIKKRGCKSFSTKFWGGPVGFVLQSTLLGT